MPTPSTDPTLAGEAAALIADSFAQYMRRFLALSRVAGAHFSNRDWHAMQRDSGRRLDLYGDAVGGTQTGLRLLLGARLADRGTWTAIRANFESLVTPGAYAELAETFFNSNVRRIFHTVGVDPEVEFVSAAIPRREYRAPWSHTRTVPCDGDLALAFRRVLEGAGLRAAWDDLRGTPNGSFAPCRPRFRRPACGPSRWRAPRSSAARAPTWSDTCTSTRARFRW